MKSLTLLLAIGVAASTLSPSFALDEDGQTKLAERRGHGFVPLCDDAKVLSKVAKKFEKNNLKHFETDLGVNDFERIREAGHLTNSPDENDRRFCIAHAQLTNGTHPTVYYLIQERDGLASLTWGVDYCFSGHDPLRYHGDKCRSLRVPF